MATLLRIDSSPLGSEASFSRQLTTEFVQRWLEAHPNGKIVSRDLASTELPLVTADWIAAAYTPEANLTPDQRAILAISNELLGELNAADEYVIGVPMHNFSLPSTLKLWIDQIVRAGKTFTYKDGAPSGLLRGKKVTFVTASGGIYEQGSPLAAMNFVEPYLRSIFGFIGVTDATFINAGGTSRVRMGVDRKTIVQPALASIRAQFQMA